MTKESHFKRKVTNEKGCVATRAEIRSQITKIIVFPEVCWWHGRHGEYPTEINTRATQLGTKDSFRMTDLGRFITERTIVECHQCFEHICLTTQSVINGIFYAILQQVENPITFVFVLNTQRIGD